MGSRFEEILRTLTKENMEERVVEESFSQPMQVKGSE